MLPKIVIIGRPNVGKSSLLNMLADRRISIVDSVAGVTRDRVSIEVGLEPAHKNGPFRYCQIIDTGGYGVYSGDEELCVLTDDIENQISLAIIEADLILFVVDAQSGITPLDGEVAQLLRKRVGKNKKVVVLANKADHEKHDANAYEAMQLGFGEAITISALTGRGKWDLIDAIGENIDFDQSDNDFNESELIIAIVGKRNAGKSTFINALAGSERVIASELPGTTRDSVDVKIKHGDRTYTIIDTAGFRKTKSMKEDVEYYSTHRALRSIRRADVVLFMVDATETISQVDKKLSTEIQTHYKPCVIVLNKWDIVEGKATMDEYLEYVDAALRGLSFAPVCPASAINNDNVSDAIETAFEMFEQSKMRVGTGELNRVVKEILEQRGPSSKLGHRAKVFFVTMPKTQPPTIVLFVNHPDMFTQNYQRYMLNNFRERLPFSEVPIKLEIRGRSRKAQQEEKPIVEL